MDTAIQEKRKLLMKKTRESMQSAYSSEEHSIIQAISAYLELEKLRNIVYERLEEWYRIFFPELALSNMETYAKFVEKFGKDKKGAKEEELRELLGDAFDSVHNKIHGSLGREPTEGEYVAIRNLAQTLVGLIEAQKRLEAFLEESTKKLMPNITYLVDYKIAAEMLKKAGSLERLGTMPASTVQLLGAEKALFKHMKFGSRSPKYGVLFKLDRVATAGKHGGGRIARVFATKISIAAKADAFSKRFIGEMLKKSLEEALAKGKASD